MTYAGNSLLPARARTVHVHLADGDPRGVRILNQAGWDGFLLVIPRHSADSREKVANELSGVGTVLLHGPAANGRIRLRITHSTSVEAELVRFRQSRHWTCMYVLGRERDYSKIVARQVALHLIHAARSKGVAEVEDTYPTPPKPVASAVRHDADSYAREALTFLTLSGLDLFDAAPTDEGDPPVQDTRSAEPAVSTAERAPVQAHKPRSRETSVRVGPPVEKASYDEDMQLLLNLRYLEVGQQLHFRQPRKGLIHTATVEPDGALRLRGKRYASPSGAAGAASGTSTNGWTAWHTAEGHVLDDLRRAARGRKARPDRTTR